jgi:hypothetical protein
LGEPLERQERLAEGTGVCWHDEANFGHLSASVGAGFVMHNNHVVEEQDAGSHRRAGTAGELFGPPQGTASEFEAVEIDAAEPEHCRAKHVARRPRFLFNHPMGGEGGQNAVHGGVGQVESSGQVTETETAGCLKGEQDTNGSINTLDHAPNFLEEIS